MKIPIFEDETTCTGCVYLYKQETYSAAGDPATVIKNQCAHLPSKGTKSINSSFYPIYPPATQKCVYYTNCDEKPELDSLDYNDIPNNLVHDMFEISQDRAKGKVQCLYTIALMLNNIDISLRKIAHPLFTLKEEEK